MNHIQTPYEILQEQLNELKKQVVLLEKRLEYEYKQEPESKRWRAQKGAHYYYINTLGGEPDVTKDERDSSDDTRFNNYNYYEKPEEAEDIAKVQLAFRKIMSVIRSEGFELFNGIKNEGYTFWIDHDSILTTYKMAGSINSLPKLKNKSDAEYLLSNYKKELMLLLGSSKL